MQEYRSTQKIASSSEELRLSYDRLYNEWLGDHRNIGQAHQLVNLLDADRGLLLDVACGLGYLLDIAEEKGADAYGLDISRVALNKAKLEEASRRVVQGIGERLPFPSDTFDHVTCLGSLEHFLDPSKGVHEIVRVLKPSGRAAIMLPNSHHLLAIYNVYHTGGILPELQDYERFATNVEWKALLENNGLRVISIDKYNVGFSRMFKRGFMPFWYFYNLLFKLLRDRWIPFNFSFSFTYLCEPDGINAEMEIS